VDEDEDEDVDVDMVALPSSSLTGER